MEKLRVAVVADASGMFLKDLSDFYKLPGYEKLKMFEIFTGLDAYKQGRKFIEENKDKFQELWFSHYW